MSLETFLINIFAFLELVIGIWLLTLGKLVFYPDEDDNSKTIIFTGKKARLIGILMIMSSIFLFSGSSYGFALLIVAVTFLHIFSPSNK